MNIIKRIDSDAGKNNWRIRESWVKNKPSSIKPNSKILDVGAGTQPYKSDCDHLQYTSLDFNEYDTTLTSYGNYYEYTA